MKFLWMLLCLLFAITVSASPNTANVLSINTASTSITTGAYVQLTASSPIPTSSLVIANTTTSILKFAIGASGSEVDYAPIPQSSYLVLPLNKLLPAGTRISLEAISATASSGYVSIGLLQ